MHNNFKRTSEVYVRSNIKTRIDFCCHANTAYTSASLFVFLLNTVRLCDPHEINFHMQITYFEHICEVLVHCKHTWSGRLSPRESLFYLRSAFVKTWRRVLLDLI